MNPRGKMQDYLKAAVRSHSSGGTVYCLDEEQLVAFYSGQLGESQAEMVRHHLVECVGCLELARETRQFLRAMSEPIQPVTAMPQASSSSWYRAHRKELLLLAASLIIAMSLVFILARAPRVQTPSPQVSDASPPSNTAPATRENPWRNLEIAKADYARAAPSPPDLIYRDEGSRTQSPSKLSPFAQAMRPYERNDFDEAERRLAQFLEKNSRHAEAHFYRGVSLLEVGKPADAIEPLRAAIEYGPGPVVEEAHWYLALAYLKENEPPKALEQLDIVIDTSSKRRGQAEQLRQQIVQFLN